MNKAISMITYLIIAAIVAIIAQVIEDKGTPYLSTPVIFSLAGVAIALGRRIGALRVKGDASIARILLSDYRFEEYATLQVLSFIYAVLQGILIGASAGFASQCLGRVLIYPSDIASYAPLLLSLSCLIALIVSRLALESYSLVYRAPQDYIKSIR